jgi:hypothetical protein
VKLQRHLPVYKENCADRRIDFDPDFVSSAESEEPMSTPFERFLLRRTFAALAAVVALVAVSDVHAQGRVRLNGAGSNECQYSSMSISPNGTVEVQCSTTEPPPPPDPVDATIPGTFKMAAATATASAGSAASVTVTRTLGGLATTVWYWQSGAGCEGTIGGINFAASQMSATFSVPITGPAGSTCVVNLSVSPPGILSAPQATEISVTEGSTGPAPVAGCAPPPADMTWANFRDLGIPHLHMQASGQVVAMPLPKTGLASGQVTFTETPAAGTPNPMVLEISISKCPGIIDTDTSNFCNLRTTNSHANNSVVFFETPYQTLNSSNVQQYGYCWAGDPGDYYVNARWSYSTCLSGQSICGFGIQHNPGPY